MTRSRLRTMLTLAFLGALGTDACSANGGIDPFAGTAPGGASAAGGSSAGGAAGAGPSAGAAAAGAAAAADAGAGTGAGAGAAAGASAGTGATGAAAGAGAAAGGAIAGGAAGSPAAGLGGATGGTSQTFGGGGAGTSAGGGTTGGSGGAPSGCAEATKYVYVITNTSDLYKFDPPKLTFTKIGTLDCQSAFATPYSMSVDRNGYGWTVFTDGTLWVFDITSAKCIGTPFVPGQLGFTTFGMGFSSDANLVTETLYVSDSGPQGLAKIDTKSLKLSAIGAYDKVSGRAEMTGLGDGSLYGAFEGTPYVVAQIDKSNAKILSQAPQSAINYPPSSSNFAFAQWGGSFWLFVGPGLTTDVFEYDPIAPSTKLVKSVDFEIVGAGVSTCAPVHKP